MQRLEQHTITKIIQKSGVVRDYYCDQHNTSYPTIQSLKEDHPSLDVSKIIPFRKVKGMSHQTVSPLQSNSKPPTKMKEERRSDIQ